MAAKGAFRYHTIQLSRNNGCCHPKTTRSGDKKPTCRFTLINSATSSASLSARADYFPPLVLSTDFLTALSLFKRAKEK
jgi:hypothetical protein